MVEAGYSIVRSCNGCPNSSCRIKLFIMTRFSFGVAVTAILSLYLLFRMSNPSSKLVVLRLGINRSLYADLFAEEGGVENILPLLGVDGGEEKEIFAVDEL